MKRKLALMLVVSLILSLGAFSTVSFAADNEPEIITTGAEFVEKVVSGKPNTTFKIEGTETLDDGSIGIRLTDNEVNHTSIKEFTGIIEGVEGKNNIQINKPLFASFGSANTTIKNINLKPDEDGTFVAGTAEGHGALVSVINSPYIYTINEVTNHCDVSSSAAYIGGLIGKVNKYGTIKLNLCSNYGSITGTTTSGDNVGGLIGGLANTSTTTITLNIEKSFNAGAIYGDRYTAGIVGRATITDGLISDCFNAGTITTTTNNGNGGGAGITVPTSGCTLTINNTYNVGEFVNKHSTLASNFAHIALKSYTSSSTNCYYIENSYAGKTTYGKQRTIEQLASGLNRLGFDSKVWEYTDTTGTNKYSLPQIIGNPFETDKTTWYIAPVDTLSMANAQSFTTSDGLYEGGLDEGEAAITDYAIVVTKFELPSGTEDFAYGMLLSEKELSDADFTKDNTSVIKVDAKKEFYGAFGIMFYGNKFVSGNTYYVKPYVEINGEYTYGAQTSFVFGAE